MVGFHAAASVLVALIPHCSAADPSSGWLTYAQWDTGGGRITALNTSWVVPSMPKHALGPSDPGDAAPGWWFGIQTKAGDGALVQPILAFGYQGPFYSMFNGVRRPARLHLLLAHCAPRRINRQAAD